MKILLKDSKLQCFLLPAFFSAEECAALLSPEIKAGYKKAIDNYPNYYRNNERLVLDLPELATNLFERIAPHLPEYLEIDSEKREEAGLWKLNSLNERLRFCRYAPGQYFHRHLDGIHYRSDTLQSKLTFMIYLNGNEEFSGGRTLFYKSRSDAEIWHAYSPQKGDLIIFDHNLWHEGEEVFSGEKFVLRSDILYERVSENVKEYPYIGHFGYIWTLLKWDEELLLSGGRDKTIRCWDENGNCTQVLYGHENSVSGLAKIDAQSFVSCSRDRTILMWKLNADGKFDLKQRISAHKATILCLQALPDGHFASAAADAEVVIFDANGTELRRLKGHNDWVWALCLISPEVLLSCSEDGTIRAWNWQSGEVLFVLNNEISCISMTFDLVQAQIFIGDLQGNISVWDLHTKKMLRRFAAHTGLVRCLLFLPEGLLVSGAEDGMVKIWNLQTEEERTVFQHLNFVQALALQQGKLISAAYDGLIQKNNLNQF